MGRGLRVSPTQAPTHPSCMVGLVRCRLCLVLPQQRHARPPAATHSQRAAKSERAVHTERYSLRGVSLRVCVCRGRACHSLDDLKKRSLQNECLFGAPGLFSGGYIYRYMGGAGGRNGAKPYLQARGRRSLAGAAPRWIGRPTRSRHVERRASFDVEKVPMDCCSADASLLVGPVDENLRCGICLSVFSEPLRTRCGCDIARRTFGTNPAATVP